MNQLMLLYLQLDIRETMQKKKKNITTLEVIALGKS